MRKNTIVGKRFGSVVIQSAVNSKVKLSQRSYTCLCDCGKTLTLRYTELRNIVLCDCNKHVHGHTTHGMSRTGIYHIWSKIISTDNVDANWKSFDTFYSDMGDRPTKDCVLSRLDSFEPYSKENCRWMCRSSIQKKVSYPSYTHQGLMKIEL